MERIERIRAAGNNNNGPVGRYHQPPPPITSDVVNELRHLIDQSDCYTVETIELNYRLTMFANLLHGYVLNDEARLSDLFRQLNETALSDDQFAPKMAFVFASQQLGALSPLDHSIRNAMITKLQDNYGAKDQLKQAGRHRFYNSITLLGEYYHRKRDAHGKRFHILGEKLLALLTSELEQEMQQCGKLQQEQYQPTYPTIDPAFAKVILSQITLNGEVAREELRQEITELMLMVRKCLLTVPNLCEWTKAFLLMALDFYHANLPQDVFDRLYTKYLVEEPKLNPEPAPTPVPVMMESPVSAAIHTPMDAPYYEPLSPEPAVGYLEDESVDALHTHHDHVATNHHLPPLPPSPQPPLSPPAQMMTAAPLEASPKERNAVSNKENKRRPPSRHEQARARHSSNQRKKLEEPESRISQPPVTSPPTTPTSRKGTTVPARTVTVSERLPSDPKKGMSSPPQPTEKLANLPKLTVTTTNTAAQSRKPPGQPASPLSPRGVLVVSSGRQQPVVQPPKSPSSRAARNGTAAAGATNNAKASQQSDQYSNNSSGRRGGGGNDRRIPSKYIIPRFAAQQRKEQEARAANASAHTATTAAPLRNGSSAPPARGGGGGGNVLKQQQQQQQHVKNTGTGTKANGQTGHHRPPRSPSKTKPSDWYSHDDRRGPASRSSRKQELPKKTTTNGDGSNGGQLGGKPTTNPPQNPVWDWAADDDYYEPEARAAPERDSGVERATYEQRKEQTINWATEEDAKPVTNAAPVSSKPKVWDWAADDDDDYQPVAVNGGPGSNSVTSSKQTIATKSQPSPPRPPPREPKKWDWAADEDEDDDYYYASAGSSNTGGGGKNLPERDIGALSTAYNERLSLDDDRHSSRKPNPNAHA
uniref:Putative serine/arginine-rich splicing factor sr45 n=1 Tax=Anopheles marajoara TaxID=58244 RepID=A0A2M4BDB6_9DIPT